MTRIFVFFAVYKGGVFPKSAVPNELAVREDVFRIFLFAVERTANGDRIAHLHVKAYNTMIARRKAEIQASRRTLQIANRRRNVFAVQQNARARFIYEIRLPVGIGVRNCRAVCNLQIDA